MNTIFIGGSRHVSRLPSEVKKRLDNVVSSGHRVVVGDANGADKAVQKHLLEKHYDNVTVFCSGSQPRNNLGTWVVHHIDAPKTAKGFQFYAAKDREMSREADFGLMIWDGKSPGTILNVLRLALYGKIAVIFNVPSKDFVNINSVDSWKIFISNCSEDLRKNIKDRATADEWQLVEPRDQKNFLYDNREYLMNREEEAELKNYPLSLHPKRLMLSELINALNNALARADTTAINETIGKIARDHGMSQVARETGLARESLYRSLDTKGNPEFTTVLKVLSSIGLTLEVKSESSEEASEDS